MSDNNLVGTEINPSSSGVGYIVIPSNIDRKIYIKSVFKNNAVMMRTEDGNLMRNVSVDNDVLQRLVFPLNDNSVGSTVVWINIPKYNNRVIVGMIDVLSAASRIINEFQYKIEEVSENGVVSALFDANTSELNLTSISRKKGLKSKINVTVSNPDADAELNVYISGTANIKASKSVNLISNEALQFTVSDADKKQLFGFIYKSGVGLTVTDEYGNEIVTDKNVVSLFSKSGSKFIDMNKDFLELGTKNETKELAVLGDTLVNFIDDFIDIIKSGKTNTSIGPQPFMVDTQLKLTKLKKRTKDLLSKSVKLD